MIALDAGANHDTLIVASQQQITATTYYYIGHTRLPQNSSDIHRFCIVFKFQKTTAAGFDTKRIVPLQAIVT